MIERFSRRVLLLVLGSSLVLPVYSAETATPSSTTENATVNESVDKSLGTFHPVLPGPLDGQIAFVTAAMLQQNHYLRQPFDAKVSSLFLDRYLEALDPQHIHFIQADLAEFEHYRTNLDRLTINTHHLGDTRPACEIFNRFVQRLEQRVAYVDELLKTEAFKFDTDEKAVLNRHDLPYPKDLAEAKQLWSERLRAEYLQELLGRIDTKKKAGNNPAVKSSGKPKSEREEIVETLTHRYHRNLRTFTDWNNDDVLQVYLTTLTHVYDPHSDYLGKAQLDSFAISMNLSLFGIGAELSSEDGYCTIRRLLPGGPAMKSKKIKEKDRIVAVAQGDQTPVDVVDMNLNKAVQLIRGPKGTEVRLTVIPAGADSGSRELVTLVRDEIPLEDQAAKAKLIELPDVHGAPVRLGVINLPSFYAPFDLGGSRRVEIAKTDAGGSTKSTSADVARLLTKLKQENIKGVILDLRQNGGGSLEEAIRLTGLFIKDGPVVQVRNYRGGVEEDDDNDPSVTYDGPLIVLTSRFSASASEILAGALQDYGRALIVGDISTHGKGTVQMVEPLRGHIQMSENSTSDPGALKLTIKKFYRPSGASTQKRGVLSDIVLPSIWNESKDIGESALENPLAYDTIPSARYDQLNLVTPYLPELRKRSAQRVATDAEFGYIREDIELFKKQQADKTVSLNEKQRLNEKEEADARQKTRDHERLARKPVPEKVYELSLKDAAQPGLPAPVVPPSPLVAKEKGSGPGLNTNSPVASVSAPAVSSGDEGTDEEKAPAIDVDLNETEHILVDYLALLPRGGGDLLTAGTAK